MYFGIAVFTYRVSPLKAIQLFGEMGFNAVSLWGHYFTSVDGAETKKLAGILNKYDMVLTIHDSFGPDRETFEKRVKRIVAWNQKFKRLFSYTFDRPVKRLPDGTVARDFETLVSGLRYVLEATDNSEIHVGAEDIPLNSDEQKLLGGLEKEYDRLGCLIDIAHMNIRLRQKPDFNEENMRKLIKDYFSNLPLKVWELHVHNNDGTVDSHSYMSYGNLNFEATAEAVKSINFKGVSTLEGSPRYDLAFRPQKVIANIAHDLFYWRELLTSDLLSRYLKEEIQQLREKLEKEGITEEQ